MKNKFILALVGLFVLSLTAQAQFITSPNSSTLTNVPPSMPAGTVSNINCKLLLTKKQGISLLPYFAGSGASSSTISLYCDVSTDGTNWTTTTPFAQTFTLNGATAVRGYWLIPPTSVDNVKWLRVNSVSNASAVTAYITNITYSVWP